LAPSERSSAASSSHPLGAFRGVLKAVRAPWLNLLGQGRTHGSRGRCGGKCLMQVGGPAFSFLWTALKGTLSIFLVLSRGGTMPAYQLPAPPLTHAISGHGHWATQKVAERPRRARPRSNFGQSPACASVPCDFGVVLKRSSTPRGREAKINEATKGFSGPRASRRRWTSRPVPERPEGSSQVSSWLWAVIPPRCPARPLLGGVRPLEPRMSAFPRFRRLHPEQQTWRPGGLKDST
jgi:hypothetical protein